MSLRKLIRALKAPPDGHPFYGNQWTGGGGGEETEQFGNNKVGSVELPAGRHPTSKEYFQARMFDRTYQKSLGIPVYASADSLPPVRSGYERFYHGTTLGAVGSIAENGLLTGANAAAAGLTNPEFENLPLIMGFTQEPSMYGQVNIIIDVPKGDIRHINDAWGEIHRDVGREEIIGILPVGLKMNQEDILWGMGVYQDYNRLYGDGA
jgi:hypothetical protein